MRLLLSMAITLAVAGSCAAGTITGARVSHKLTTSDTFTNGNVATTQKLSLSTSLEADLLPTEVDGFGSQTRIHVSFPVGPDISFRLDDDPNYVAGDTAIRINKSILFNGIEWKTTISMRWSGLVLRLSVRAIGSQKVQRPSLVQQLALPKAATTLETTQDLVLGVSGDNSGDGFLRLVGTVPVLIKTTDSSQTARSGATKIGSKQQIKGAL